MNYENRKYMIIKVEDLPNINFETVLETSEETVRKSVDGAKTIVKWDGDMPSCVSSLTECWGAYTHEQILNILSTKEWSSENEIEE